MKKIFLSFLILFGSIYTNAQNSLPVVSNIHSTIDTVSNIIKLFYDVADTDNDQLEITFGVSNNSGTTFLVEVTEAAGDFGFPITPGAEKSITCNYDHATAGFHSDFTNFMIRVSADDKQEIDIQNIVNSVNSTKLWSDLLMIEGTRNRTDGLQHLLEVRDTLTSRIQSKALQYRLNEFTFGGANCQNIIGRLPGLTNEKATIIIDGHYDCVPGSPGADDNGTAVAGVLQAINVLSEFNFKKTLEFIFFDVEEDGLVGSRRYVQTDRPNFNLIEGVINFEMVGYYSDAPNSQIIPPGFELLFPAAVASIQADQNKGNFLLNTANVNSNSLRFVFDSCAVKYVPELRVISLAVAGFGTVAPILRRSDHASFWDASIKALMLTDGAETRNTNYHTANDASSTLNQQFYTNVVKATIATAAKLAEPIHAGFSSSNVFEFETTTDIVDVVNPPASFEMTQNYPNPFNPSTRISYSLAAESRVKLTLYTYIGEKVFELLNSIQSAGEHQVIWNASGFSSGVYYVRAEVYDTNSNSLSAKSIKLTLIK
ncbi:MAG: M20/M25/M40 family metallo-hydrolase [bacterium]